MKVHAMLSPGVITAEPLESLTDAASRMRESKVGALAVLDAGKLVGILTERDLVDALAEGLSPRVTPVSAYMTPEPTTVDADDECSDAALTMLELGVRHLPVTRGGELVGMVSARDLLVLTAWPEPSPPVAPVG